MTNLQQTKKSRKRGRGWIIFFLILTGATLPFHYVPSHLKVFPKNNLTFSHTIILEEDIDELLERYNDASFYEKLAIKEEPFFRKLTEKGIIYEIDE